jgi:branched-chain amino acid transport system permease protein
VHTPAAALVAHADAPIDIVRVAGLSKAFGGIHAARDLDFVLRRGEVTALIGPNGAGKSTVFSLLTGQQRADSGRVLLRGVDISGKTTDAIARAGMVRSFQHMRLVGRLTALQNVMLAIPGQRGEQFANLWLPWRRLRTDELAHLDEARGWLRYVGLEHAADSPAASLSFGEQKLLSLARTLATRADVLLLDEPASGIEGVWVDRMLELIQRVCADGRTVCIVEHNLDLVRRIAGQVLFLELGVITARGGYKELVDDPRLAEAYFGTQ